ncbi:MAG TPA: TlyA family RNA methyltransferase [Bacillota bacterium]
MSESKERRERNRVRLDVLLVDKGLFPSRERAQGAILAGLVYVGGAPATKPGTRYPSEAAVEVRGNDLPFVSRGGLKLEKALGAFAVDVRGLVAVDVGASTGGFTDCLLKRGAALVYAVDVGYGQLAWSLRNDPRVVVLERTNARFLDREDLERAFVAAGAGGEAAPMPNLATADVSFISLDKILPALAGLVGDDGRAVCLVKPQFEAGRGEVGKKGVVRDPEVHRNVLERVTRAALEAGFFLTNLTYSPVTGPEGNIEYLAMLTRPGRPPALPTEPLPAPPGLSRLIDQVVQEAHLVLS